MEVRQLAEKSKQIIRLNQHPSGSYIACPLFANYAYCWLRDGTFTAYAMDAAGEHDSADMFYQWAHRILIGKREQVDRLIEKKRNGQDIRPNEFLNARFHLDGRDDDAEWGHFQLDGYGTLLWGMAEHARRTGDESFLDRHKESIEIAANYLIHFWNHPCFDCWEENQGGLHPSSLACLYGGLRACGQKLNHNEWLSAAEQIRSFVLKHGASNGKFVKSLHADASVANHAVDASLMWLAVPFGLVPLDDPLMQSTLKEIERHLCNECGIHRYPEDTYYGGGQWPLLTAWYGWLKATEGDAAEARRCLAWIADQADAEGRLTEQVRASLLNEAKLNEWLSALGTPATPLLWSHAMYLVLYGILQDVAD
jgi:GH15 family glucan-1,4-alpha-glucosidase